MIRASIAVLVLQSIVSIARADDDEATSDKVRQLMSEAEAAGSAVSARVKRFDLGAGSVLWICGGVPYGPGAIVAIDHDADWTASGTVTARIAPAAIAAALNGPVSSTRMPDHHYLGTGNALGAQFVVSGMDDDEVRTRLLALLEQLSSPRIGAHDVAEARDLFSPPDVDEIGGQVPARRALLRRLYPTAPAGFEAEPFELGAIAAELDVHKVTAWVKRWREGYARIVVVGGFDDGEADRIAAAVRAKVHDWNLRGPVAVSGAPVAAPPQRVVDRLKGPWKTFSALAFGQVVPRPDAHTERVWELLQPVMQARVEARLKRDRLARFVIVRVRRIGESLLVDGLVLLTTGSDPGAADAAVRDALGTLVNRGPTAAELVDAKLSAIRAHAPDPRGVVEATALLTERYSEGVAIARELAGVRRSEAAAALRALDPKKLTTTVAGDAPARR